MQVVVLCLVGLTMMTSCGAEEAMRPSTMTKAEFRQKANETCYEANSEIFEEASRARRLEKGLEKVISARVRAFREFSKLHPPIESQSDFVAFKQTVVARNRISRQLVEKLRQGNFRLGWTMSSLNNEMVRAKALASRLKLSNCPML